MTEPKKPWWGIVFLVIGIGSLQYILEEEQADFIDPTINKKGIVQIQLVFDEPDLPFRLSLSFCFLDFCSNTDLWSFIDL